MTEAQSDAQSEAGTMVGVAAPPRDNGTLVFAAPWEGRAFAIAVEVVDRLGLPWEEFRTRLIAAISAVPTRPYYESWAAALEHLLVDHGVCSTGTLDDATPSERATL